MSVLSKDAGSRLCRGQPLARAPLRLRKPESNSESLWESWPRSASQRADRGLGHGICRLRLAQESWALHYTKKQSIPKRLPAARRRVGIPGGKPSEQPSAAAPAAWLSSNRSPGRGAGTQMKETILFSGKQLCLCHLLLLSSQNDFVCGPASSADVSPALGIACGG